MKTETFLEYFEYFCQISSKPILIIELCRFKVGDSMFETLCRIHYRRSKWPKLAAAGWKRHRVLCTASPLSWTSRQVKVKVKGRSTAAPVHRTWWSQAVASARQGLRVRARPRTTTSPYTDRPRHLSPATIITCIIIITSSSSNSS